MELNDLRIIVCLRKSEVSVEKFLDCNVMCNVMEKLVGAWQTQFAMLQNQ